MRLISAAAILALGAASALADMTVEMTMVNDKGLGDAIGKVTISENQYGIVLTPALKGLPPGAHGFHLHQNPSCDPQEKDGKMTPALAAGGHFDPAETKRHGAPWADGHLGDLPVLVVDADGNTAQPVLSPRLKMADVAGRALMIHAGGDNYADEPAPLGGGGGRIACGVVK